LEFMQNSVPKSPAKPKPGHPLNAKALAAYHSELRRYEKSLVEYQRFLESRERELVSWEEALEERVDGLDEEDDDNPYGPEECECGQEEALGGCDCEACESWRFAHKATVTYEKSEAKQRNAPAAPTAGDEVDFLERMFKLKDKRK
jgi:hypothetical protein